MLLLLPQRYVFSSKSQPIQCSIQMQVCCCCYHKGTYFQANHNCCTYSGKSFPVVVATTKVRIFKQITTPDIDTDKNSVLLLLPQRYVFSSKSQQSLARLFEATGCCCYHKGTYFQANHNLYT